jgi:hypothetical protein
MSGYSIREGPATNFASVCWYCNFQHIEATPVVAELSNELGTVVHSQVTCGASFEAGLIESVVTSRRQSLGTLS